jgi:O-antigen/teichoic acid export membrane protein
MDRDLKINISARIIEAFVSILCSLCQCAILSRYLSASEFGYYSLLLTYIFFLHGASFLFSNIAIFTKEVGQGGCIREKTSCLVALQILIALVGCLVLTVLISFIEVEQPLGQHLLFIGTFFLFLTIPISLQAILYVKLAIIKIAIVNIISQLLSVLLLTYFTYKSFAIEAIFYAVLTPYVIQGIFYLHLSKFYNYFCLRSVSFSSTFRFIKISAPIGLVALVGTLYIRMDQLMISYFLSSKDVALYSAAFQLQDYLILIANTMIMAVFPKFTELANQSMVRFRELYSKILGLIVYLFLPLIVIAAFFGENLVTYLYGKDFEDASSPLVLLFIAALFVWINSPSGSILISFNKQKIYFFGSIISLFFNFIGNLILIPRLGITGAALSTLIAEISLTIFSLYQVRKIVGFLPFLSGNPVCHRLKVMILELKESSL